jgi:ADP-ribosylglycohydrolase
MLHATGSLFGLAFGDALGKPTEFMGYAEIGARYGPAGPRELEGRPALVTDDTQMALCVADALLEAPDVSAAALEPLLRQRFMAWAVSPENNRAPGMTCLRAIGRMGANTSWLSATERGSKGCGANMRVTPVGVVPGLSDDDRSGAAQLQAALTHGHPTALAASELTAYAVHWLRSGLPVRSLPGALRSHAVSQRLVYREDWLSTLWQGPGASSPEEFISRGWDECLAVLDRLDAALAVPDRDSDPCGATGAGWIAEEALATAVHCFLLYPDDPVSALSRAAWTSGDSDSIACLTGAFAGAAYGMEVWPSHWEVEYAAELTRIGAAWD